MIILGPYAKNGVKISKNARDFVILKIFWQLCQISVINIKCPSFGQMSIFWGLVFCRQLYIYVSHNLWIKKWGSLAVMVGSFLRGHLFEFFLCQKVLNWHIWKVIWLAGYEMSKTKNGRQWASSPIGRRFQEMVFTSSVGWKHYRKLNCLLVLFCL